MELASIHVAWNGINFDFDRLTNDDAADPGLMNTRINLHVFEVWQVDNRLTLAYRCSFLDQNRFTAATTVLRSVNDFTGLAGHKAAGGNLPPKQLEFFLFNRQRQLCRFIRGLHLRHQSFAFQTRTSRFTFGVFGDLFEFALFANFGELFKHCQLAGFYFQNDLGLCHLKTRALKLIDVGITQAGLVTNSFVLFFVD